MNIINDFVLSTCNDANNQLKKIFLGKLSDLEVKTILDKTKINLVEYNRIIDNYAIKHTFRKHGDHKNETLRGQVGVKISDFDLIYLILKNPDTIEYGGKNNIGRDVIMNIKQIENLLYFYVEEVRINKKELAMQTLYIRQLKQKTT